MKARYELPMWVDVPAVSHRGLDAAAAEVSRRLSTPVALVTCVSRAAQVMPGAVGLSGPLELDRSVPLDYSLCKYVVTSGEPLVVSDLREHPILRNNPVIEEFGVLAYLGVPLRSGDGPPVGALCALSDDVRHWSADDVNWMNDYSRRVAWELRVYLADIVMAETSARVSRMRSSTKSAHQRSLSDLAQAVDATWRHGVLDSLTEQLEGVPDVGRIVDTVDQLARERLEAADVCLVLMPNGSEEPRFLRAHAADDRFPFSSNELSKATDVARSQTARFDRSSMVEALLDRQFDDQTLRSTDRLGDAYIPLPTSSQGARAALALRWLPGTPTPTAGALADIAAAIAPSLDMALVNAQRRALINLIADRDRRE